MATSRTHQSLSIDECLFGPSRVCPIAGVVQDDDDSVPMSPSSETISSPERRKEELRASTSGIDDLEDGRWLAAKYSPEKTPSSTEESQQSCQQHLISLPDLRRLASQGISDTGSWRPVAWRVLLGYLPTDTSLWKDTLQEHRSLYRSLVTELFRDESDELHRGNELRGHHGKKRAAAAAQKRKQQQQEEASSRHEDNATTSTAEAVETLHDDTSYQRSQSDATSSPTAIESTEAAVATTPQRRRSNSIGGTLPEDMGRTERRLDLVGGETSSTALMTSPSSKDDTALLLPATAPSPLLKSPITIRNSSHDDRGYETLVPARIREEWKRSGRDTAALLAGMSGGGAAAHGSVNTLMVSSTEQHAHTTDRHPPSTTTTEGSSNDNTAATTTTNPSHSNNTPTDHHHDSAKWYQFFENATLLDEIRKDVVRTHPDLYFFLQPEHNLGQRRYAALERILFVWAKLNKGVRYVQGMNEIVGTLYYVLANDLNEEWACEAEADAYFLFNSLMIEMRDVFVPALDDADTGIQGRIANMSSLLALHDPEVHCHLDDCGIDASFYAIRWLTTLLSREFLLPDTIRLWDSMFASTHKDNFLRYVCVTMVMVSREDLLKGDFSTCLRLLQSYPPTNLDQLLESGRALWIYESQITMACHKGGVSLHQALSTITPPPAIVMAYGLKGGVAMRHHVVDREEIQPTNSNGSNTTSANSLSVSGRNLLQGARGFLGGLGREASNIRRKSSSSSNLS